MTELSNSALTSQGEVQSLDIQGILGILPHRYPFLLVDRITEIIRTKRIVAIKNVTANEPYFVLLLTEFPDREERLLLFTGIDKAKFRRPVAPGDQLRIEVDVLVWRGTAGRMQGKAYVGDKLACEAIITCRLLRRPRKTEAAAEPALEQA